MCSHRGFAVVLDPAEQSKRKVRGDVDYMVSICLLQRYREPLFLILLRRHHLDTSAARRLRCLRRCSLTTVTRPCSSAPPPPAGGSTGTGAGSTRSVSSSARRVSNQKFMGVVLGYDVWVGVEGVRGCGRC